MNRAEYAAMRRVEDTLWWYVGMREIVAALIGPKRLDGTTRILDAGCGTGGTLAWWGRRRAGGRAHGFGVDLSPDAVRFAADRGLPGIARGSVTDLPYADATFDGVVSLDVVYHLSVANDGRAIEEAARVVRPGGWVCIRVPAFDALRSAHDAAVHTRERYLRGDLVARVAAAGLKIERATYANAVLFPAAVASRLWRRVEVGGRTHGDDVESDVRPASTAVQLVGRVALACEAAIVRRADLPFGLSVVVVATRTPEAHDVTQDAHALHLRPRRGR